MRAFFFKNHLPSAKLTANLSALVKECNMEKRKGRPPGVILTADDAEAIRQMHEWKLKEIERINKTASVQAIAEKFGASKRAIERVLAYETH